MADNLSLLFLFSWYERLRVDLLSRYSVTGGFQLEWFIVLGIVGCYGSGGGLSVKAIGRVLHTSVSGVTHRAVEMRLSRLVQYGYVVRVKRGRFFYYSLSSHAEKLLRQSVGAKELKRLNTEIRLLLKS